MSKSKQTKISTLNYTTKNYPYKVSIIVPCYNTKPWLDECLQSLVNQTLEEIEIICINDGSTDGTGDRLNEWESEYPNKIKVINQANSGLSNARNAGMAIAQGECIGFVDSDDFVEICMYEKLYTVYKDNSADVVICDYLDSIATTKSNYNGAIIKKHLLDLLTYAPAICISLYSNNFLQKYKIQFVPDLIYEDIIFHFDILINASIFIKLQQRFYFYRQNRKNQITSLSGKKVYDIFKVFEYIDNKNYTTNNKIDKYLLRYKIKNLLTLFKRIDKRYKLNFLFKASKVIFTNNKVANIYKNLLVQKYRKPINYMLVFMILILLHCCYLWQKIPFISKKNFNF